MKIYDQLIADYQIWVDTAIEFSTDSIKSQYAKKISWHALLLAALKNSSSETQHLFTENMNPGYRFNPDSAIEIFSKFMPRNPNA